MEEVNKLSDVSLYKSLSLGYKPSDSVIKAFGKIKYSPLVGISSSGRDTLIRKLELKYPDYFHDLITTTTRKPRANNGILEQNGREYFFISEEEFLSKIKNREMIEWSILHNQQLSGLDRVTFQDIPSIKYIINDIDVPGVIYLMNYSNIIKPIFVIPPSFKIWQERLNKRGKLPKKEFDNRMRSSHNEIGLALKEERFYFVINDDLNEATDEIFNYIDKGIKLNQAKARLAAEELLSEIEKLIRGDS
jgi:guanylate kinase